MRFLSSQWLKAGVSLTLFAILLGSSDLHVFMQHIAAARLDFFLLAFLGYLFGQTLSAYKWRMLAQPLGFDQPLRAFAVYYFVGMYLNLFAPGTVAGDLGRGVLLAQDKGGIGPALQSVLADRVSGVVMLLWVSAAGFILLGPTVLPLALCYGTVTTAFLAIAGWWALPHVMPLFCSPGQWLYRLVDKVILPYRARTALLAGVCGLSFTFHLFQLGLQMLLAHALGLTVPVWYLVLFIPLVNILSYLPLSFTGAGVREGGYVFFLSLVGIVKEEALAFGLLWTAMLFATGLCGGVVLLLSTEARFSLRRTEALADGSPLARGEELKRTTDG